MTLRDIKAAARAALHTEMKVQALYLVKNPLYVTPVVDPDIPEYIETPVGVRVHDSFKALGDMKGTNFHFAEAMESMPRIVFWREEFSAIERGAIISVEAGEAYKIDSVEPPDGLTITAPCTRLSAAQAAGLPLYEAP